MNNKFKVQSPATVAGQKKSSARSKRHILFCDLPSIWREGRHVIFKIGEEEFNFSPKDGELLMLPSLTKSELRFCQAIIKIQGYDVSPGWKEMSQSPKKLAAKIGKVRGLSWRNIYRLEDSLLKKRVMVRCEPNSDSWYMIDHEKWLALSLRDGELFPAMREADQHPNDAGLKRYACCAFKILLNRFTKND